MAILAAAGEQFADHGYAEASLNVIADRCGLTKGSLYFHYRNKQELAGAVLAEMLERWHERCVHVAALGLDPLRSLIATVDALFDMMAGYPVVRGGVRLADTTADWAVTLKEGPSAFDEDVILEELTRSRDAGLLLPHIDPADTARHLVAVLVGHRALRAGRILDVREIRARVLQAFALFLPAVVTQAWLDDWKTEGAIVEHKSFERAT